jgi:hypothetical protein
VDRAALVRKIAELEAHEKELVGNRGFFQWVAIGLMVLAPFCLLVHPVLTFGVGIVGLSLWGVSAYLAYLYVKETQTKIGELKAVLAKLPVAEVNAS